MNAQTQTRYARLRSSLKTAPLLAVLAFSLGGQTNQALAGDDYSENALTNPSEALLQAEAQGRVTIYDGLEHKVVDQALDTQFKRIDNMMFVNTRETLPNGSLGYYDDDDCD